MKVFQPLPLRTGDDYLVPLDTLRDGFLFDVQSLDAPSDVPTGGCRISSEWLCDDGLTVRILTGHRPRGGAQ